MRGENMEKITVRKAVTGDAEAIARLLTEVGKVHSEYLAFVAEEDGKVCGETICRICERAADKTYRARKWLYIDDLCVTEKCRGGQAASALMKAAEEYARSCGCVSVELGRD